MTADRGDPRQARENEQTQAAASAIDRWRRAILTTRLSVQIATANRLFRMVLGKTASTRINGRTHHEPRPGTGCTQAEMEGRALSGGPR